jgi:hypothetical protein
MAKIYLAAKYSQRETMFYVRDVLRAVGHEVTARWIDGTDTFETGGAMSLEDVRRSDVLIAFSLDRGDLHAGGGRHVEFGIALERGIRIMVVGPKGEHVFHMLPQIEHYNNLDEARAALPYVVCERCKTPEVCGQEKHCDLSFNGYR